ncbi:MAG: hypothetical protein K6T17_03155, partial [Fimbriimonadales bacterium]|nr:hypothetical protein [Fimbriimonadales bacterium]
MAGLSYVLRFAMALQSPLHGVSYQYRTPSGWATLQASTVHLNVRDQKVHVRGLLLWDPANRRVARAEGGEISYAWGEGKF